MLAIEAERAIARRRDRHQLACSGHAGVREARGGGEWDAEGCAERLSPPKVESPPSKNICFIVLENDK